MRLPVDGERPGPVRGLCGWRWPCLRPQRTVGRGLGRGQGGGERGWAGQQPEGARGVGGHLHLRHGLVVQELRLQRRHVRPRDLGQMVQGSEVQPVGQTHDDGRLGVRRQPDAAAAAAAAAARLLGIRIDGRIGGLRVGGRGASEGKGPHRPPQQRFDRRLEEVAKAVGGGYSRLQMPLKLALGVRGTVAAHGLGARAVPPPPRFPMHRWCGWRGPVNGAVP